MSMAMNGGGESWNGGEAPGNKPKAPNTNKKDLLSQAQKDFERANSWESVFRGRFIDDLKFDAGDAYNNFQWPDSVKMNRDTDQRPYLTINKVQQHNKQIINDAKQNKPSIAIRPTGNESTYESAKAIGGLIRHIEYQSNAQVAYDVASGFQVKGGYGVLRVATDYIGEEFDKEIFIRPVPDPLTVLFDPDARQPDKSDSRFAFVFDDIDRDEFGRIYPQYADYVPSLQFGGGNAGDWLGKKSVRIAEYFWVTEKKDKKVRYINEKGEVITKMLSTIAKEMSKQVLDDPRTRARTVVWNEVHWALIVGENVVEEQIVPGVYIPLVPMLGEEYIINGTMDRKGHTRALIDPQRMYNYYASAAVEYGALQTKTPWVAPTAAIEGLETYWNNANKQNVSVLPYNHISDDGTETIPPPFKPEPPQQASLYIQGLAQCREEMMMVSGQYQAQMGQPSNERSGKAIQERQRQGDNATYHFIDNQAIAIRQVGRIILGWIPFVYDAKRAVQILAEDGKSFQVMIDLEAQKAYQEQQDENHEVVLRILNPNIGKYSVEVDIGPGYATKRQEAANGMQQILTNAPELTSIMGDILLRNLDFPGAEEAAQRMERMVPPQAMGKGPSQQEQALQMQLNQTQQLLKSAMDRMASLTLKLQGKEQMREIDVYKAETDRFGKVLQYAPQPEGAVDPVIHQLVREMMHTEMLPVIHTAVQSMMGQFGPPNTQMPSMAQSQIPNPDQPSAGLPQ